MGRVIYDLVPRGLGSLRILLEYILHYVILVFQQPSTLFVYFSENLFQCSRKKCLFRYAVAYLGFSYPDKMQVWLRLI